MHFEITQVLFFGSQSCWFSRFTCFFLVSQWNMQFIQVLCQFIILFYKMLDTRFLHLQDSRGIAVKWYRTCYLLIVIVAFICMLLWRLFPWIRSEKTSLGRPKGDILARLKRLLFSYKSTNSRFSLDILISWYT